MVRIMFKGHCMGVYVSIELHYFSMKSTGLRYGRNGGDVSIWIWRSWEDQQGALQSAPLKSTARAEF